MEVSTERREMKNMAELSSFLSNIVFHDTIILNFQLFMKRSDANIVTDSSTTYTTMLISHMNTYGIYNLLQS